LPPRTPCRKGCRFGDDHVRSVTRLGPFYDKMYGTRRVVSTKVLIGRREGNDRAGRRTVSQLCGPLAPAGINSLN
jgi:hypothetical protein